jgi:hypothetical protein
MRGKPAWNRGMTIPEEQRVKMRKPHRVTSKLLKAQRKRQESRRGKHIRGRVITCQACGNQFYVPECRITGAATKYQGQQKYCSRECQLAGLRKPPEQCADKERLRKWSLAVKARDHYCCVVCGCKDKELLQAHHKVAKRNDPDLWYDIANGETLCIACHALSHCGEQVVGLILSGGPRKWRRAILSCA